MLYIFSKSIKQENITLAMKKMSIMFELIIIISILFMVWFSLKIEYFIKLLLPSVNINKVSENIAYAEILSDKKTVRCVNNQMVRIFKINSM